MKRIHKFFAVVCAVHGALLLGGITDYFLHGKKAKKQAMIVRTVREERISGPIVKKGEIKSTLPKKPDAKVLAKKQTQKKETPSIHQNVLAQLAKDLSQLRSSEKPKKITAPLTLPKAIALKTEVEASSLKNNSYVEELMKIFMSSLDLPEFGSVKILLKIDRSGSVMGCKILEEKSRKNSEFLKNRLHELPLPCFNDFGLSDDELEFTITFENL